MLQPVKPVAMPDQAWSNEAVPSAATATCLISEEAKRTMEAQNVRAEIQQPQAPLLPSVEMIPDAAAGIAHATPHSGDGSVAPIAVDPEATNPHAAQ